MKKILILLFLSLALLSAGSFAFLVEEYTMDLGDPDNQALWESGIFDGNAIHTWYGDRLFVTNPFDTGDTAVISTTIDVSNAVDLGRSLNTSDTLMLGITYLVNENPNDYPDGADVPSLFAGTDFPNPLFLEIGMGSLGTSYYIPLNRLEDNIYSADLGYGYSYSDLLDYVNGGSVGDLPDMVYLPEGNIDDLITVSYNNLLVLGWDNPSVQLGGATQASDAIVYHWFGVYSDDGQVPEPATFAYAAMGLASIAGLRRKFKK